MSRVCILLIATLFMVASASEFQRFSLDQGRVSFRSLADAAPTTTLSRNLLLNYTNNSVATVSLGDTYLANNPLIVANETAMTVFLFTNATGFCNGCSEFVEYNCTYDSCKQDNVTTGLTVLSPHYTVSGSSAGYVKNIIQNVTIGNGTNPQWSLNTPALKFYYYSRNHKDIYQTGNNRNYIYNTSSYGFIGLGVGGNAASNFKGDHPIFSVQVNGSGQGQLIFGNDATLYDSKRAGIMTLPCDTNWTLQSQNMSFGPLINNTAFKSNVVFDLQYPGIGLPYSSFIAGTNIWDNLIKQYNLTQNTTFDRSYYYVYNGSLTNLPNLQIGLSNNLNITIPPVAYTKLVANNTYLILLSRINQVSFTDELGNKIEAESTVLGWSFLSQYYTVFEQTNTAGPVVTLYPTYAIPATPVTPSTGTSFGTRLLQVAVVAVIIAAVYMAFKNKAASKLQDELGTGLREGQRY